MTSWEDFYEAYFYNWMSSPRTFERNLIVFDLWCRERRKFQ